MTQSRDIGYNKGQRLNQKPRLPRILPLGFSDLYPPRIVPIVDEVVSKHYAKGLCTFTVRPAIASTASQSSGNSRAIPIKYATEI